VVNVTAPGSLRVQVVDKNSRVWYTFYNGAIEPGRSIVPVNPGPHFMPPGKTNDDFLAYGEYKLVSNLKSNTGATTSYTQNYVHKG